ncbi:hypothetical protein S245_050313, partial [Arachis hypogaea]
EIIEVFLKPERARKGARFRVLHCTGKSEHGDGERHGLWRREREKGRSAIEGGRRERWRRRQWREKSPPPLLAPLELSLPCAAVVVSTLRRPGSAAAVIPLLCLALPELSLVVVGSSMPHILAPLLEPTLL